MIFVVPIPGFRINEPVPVPDLAELADGAPIPADVLDRLPGRWVLFDRDFTVLYGEWREWHGMRYFLPIKPAMPSWLQA